MTALPKPLAFRPVHDPATLRALGVPESAVADCGCGCTGTSCGDAPCVSCATGRAASQQKPGPGDLERPKPPGVGLDTGTRRAEPRAVVDQLLRAGAARPLNILVAAGTATIVSPDFTAKKREERPRKKKNEPEPPEPPPQSQQPQGPTENEIETLTVWWQSEGGGAIADLEFWAVLLGQHTSNPLGVLPAGFSTFGHDGGSGGAPSSDDDVAEEVTVTAPPQTRRLGILESSPPQIVITVTAQKLCPISRCDRDFAEEHLYATKHPSSCAFISLNLLGTPLGEAVQQDSVSIAFAAFNATDPDVLTNLIGALPVGVSKDGGAFYWFSCGTYGVWVVQNSAGGIYCYKLKPSDVPGEACVPVTVNCGKKCEA